MTTSSDPEKSRPAHRFPGSLTVRWMLTLTLLSPAGSWVSVAVADESKIPEVLQPWKDWVTWGVKHRDCPTLYSSADHPVCFWPSQLALAADAEGGTWSMSVRAFERTWIPLPGSSETWPVKVRAGEDALVVVERAGQPATELSAGMHELSGEFRWRQMPQQLRIPQQIGVLSLTVEGAVVDAPSWDDRGAVWLKRTTREAADKDLLQLQVYRLLEDGIPVWLRTELELTVSGKSREETLGCILPEGWRIATVESPIPVAVDDAGELKAQVRAGKWLVSLHAYRTTDVGPFRYASDAQPAAGSELIALKTDPAFRISQFKNRTTIDVTQTTFPEKWRGLPVYQWDSATTMELEEKMRGLGDQRLEGLHIQRRLWLDEDGGGLTYQDQIRGQGQHLWRLDVARGHELGAVRVDGQGQLITANPETDASGVEIRRRDLNMQAVGRMDRAGELAATGWQTDADSLRVTLTLPPGWRVLAVLGAGADRIDGDWLTAWSLLDLFLLLIFSLAVFRLFGVPAGIIAFLAFGLAYHEPGAPRYTWLLLLMPVALLRVAGEGAARKWVLAWQYVAIAGLLICLIPFIAMQTQSVIYPQLDTPGVRYGTRDIFRWPATQYAYQADFSASRWSGGGSVRSGQVAQIVKPQKTKFDVSNLNYTPKARIQTGPAQPQWSWNDVHCIWNSPVTAEQTFQPILISSSQHRMLTALRVAMLMILAAIVLGADKIRIPFLGRKSAVAASVLVLLMIPAAASAQIPDAEVLQTLRQRLLETPDVFPGAADIPSVDLTLRGNNLTMTAHVQAVTEVAVPLPGRLPAWSPVSVTLDGQPDVLISRRDGFLWVLVPAGVHQIVVHGKLPNETQWEWNYLLKPRYIDVDAPGWKITGITENGMPGEQVFFSREQVVTDDQAAYDRKHLSAVVVVDRFLEVGLIWKVRSEVTRLSSPGKAITIDIPLLPGERVLASGREVQDGRIEVSLSESQDRVHWESELPVGQPIRLQAAQVDRLVERWHVITSPIWNVTIDGISPVFEADQTDLIPVWHPWPGESVIADFSRLTAVGGEITTIQNVSHDTTISSRMRSGKLTLDLECSLANDFLVQLPPQAEVTSLTMDGQAVPVQRDGDQLIIPARPKRQSVSVHWKTTQPISAVAQTGAIQLPVEASNIATTMIMPEPENRWILWADGPLRGPAVRFWTILTLAILAAIALSLMPLSPLRLWEWILLMVGLTQVHLIAAMMVVGWLFLLAWRGTQAASQRRFLAHNLTQIGIIFLTLTSLGVLMVVVGEGLLGNPDMFIVGNGSSATHLRWFQPRSGVALPQPYVVSISVWFYRLLMLVWALWLATALLRWLGWGWKQFSSGGVWRNPRQGELQTAAPQAPMVNPQ